MTKKEILKIFNKIAILKGKTTWKKLPEDDDFYGNGPDYIIDLIGDEDDEPIKLEDGTEICCKDSFGGEGLGDDYWVVFSIKTPKEEIFIKYNGYYNSYQGTEWDDDADIDSFKFVKPVEVMKIKWDRYET